MKKASSPQRSSAMNKVRDESKHSYIHDLLLNHCPFHLPCLLVLEKKKFIEPVQSSFSRMIEDDEESIDSNLSYYEV